MRTSFNTLSQDDQFTVRTSPLFAGMDDASFTKVVAFTSVTSLPAKSTIFREDEPATDIYIVLEGWVKLYRLSAAGDEAIINVFTSTQSFAEAVALSGAPYPATAEAISDCRLVRISTASLINAMRANVDIALSMLTSTTVHLHRLVGEITRLKGLNGFARMVEFLQDIAGPSQCMEFILPFEKQVLARHLGMQPESLSRALKKLRDYGIEIDGPRVKLASADALKRAAADA